MINLLSPQLKKEISQEANWRFFIILGILVLFFLLSLFLILLAVKIYISSQSNTQEVFLEREKEQFKKAGMEEVEDKIKLINQELFRLNSFCEEQFQHTDFLQRLAEALPAGSYFTEIHSEYHSLEEGLSITLKGFSPSSMALRSLRNNLEADADIYAIDLSGMNPDNFLISLKVKI